METRIVEAVGRGYYHGSTMGLKQSVVYDLFDRLKSISRNKRVPVEIQEEAFMMAYALRPVMGGSIGDTFENDLMKLIFGAVAIANIADNAASSPLTALGVSLHTADPGETGNQTTSETSYTSYARVSSARDTSTSSRWVVTNNTANPNANIDFPAGTGGSGTVTHFAVGTNTSNGTGKILFSGSVSPSITVGNGVTPRLTTASAITLD